MPSLCSRPLLLPQLLVCIPLYRCKLWRLRLHVVYCFCSYRVLQKLLGVVTPVSSLRSTLLPPRLPVEHSVVGFECSEWVDAFNQPAANAVVQSAAAPVASRFDNACRVWL